MSSVELQGRVAWKAWAEYRWHGFCDACERPRYVGRATRGGWAPVRRLLGTLGRGHSSVAGVAALTVTVRIPTDTWVLPRPRPDAYVGGFPLHFERRLWEVLGRPEKVLHPFGGLAEIGDSVDLNATTTPTWVGDAHDLHFIEDESYDLVVLDPPYSDEEAEWLYGTPPLRWTIYTAEAVRVCKTGGHVAIYLDRQPARPEGTKLVRRIVVLTRTWHTPRVCFVFERLGAQGSLLEAEH